MENQQILDTKHIKVNAIINLISKLLTALVVFAFAKVIITFYGDELNGIVRSTTMITGYFTIADAGIAAIISQRLYKVIMNNDKEEIIRIISTSKKMFKFISLVFIVIAASISLIYPFFINRNGVINYQFIISLLFVLSIKVIPRYLWTLHYDIMLTNTQRGYIYKVITFFTDLFFYGLATLVILFNKPILSTVTSHDKSILVLAKGYENYKWIIIAALILPALSDFVIAFIMKKVCDKKFPWLTFIYVSWKDTRNLWKDAKYTLITHITWLIVFSTDEIVLTIYSHKVGATYSMYLVSLLSFYGMVISTVRSTMDSAFSSMLPYLGLKTKGIDNVDKKTFKLFFLNVVSCSLFICLSLIVITPIFVQVFFAPSKGAEYFDIKLASIIALNCFLYLILTPYKILFYIKGDFKGMLLPNAIEATINLAGSLIVVWFFGIYGILIMTTIAMTYVLIHFAFASRKYIDGITNVWHNISLFVSVSMSAIFLCSAFVVSRYINSIDMEIWKAILYIGGVGTTAIVLIGVVAWFTKKQATKNIKQK